MSADKYPNVKVGQNVRLTVPDIDRQKLARKTLLQL